MPLAVGGNAIATPSLRRSGPRGDLDGGTRGATLLPERGPSAPGEELRLRYAAVTADFFPTIGVPVQRGRGFEAFEGTTHSGVAVVNAAMAARLWPSEDPLGRQFRFADAADSEPFRVIGVLPDFNNEGVVDERAPVPTAYIPFAYDPARDAGLMVRTAGDPAAMTPAIREAIRALDANLPLNEVRSMAQLQRDESWAFNFTAWAFGLLGRTTDSIPTAQGKVLRHSCTLHRLEE